MDYNIVILMGKLAAPPEVKTYESGIRHIRLLLTVRLEAPRRRVDVIPVTVWSDNHEISDDKFDELADLQSGQRLWITGQVERRFWDSQHGRRSRIEILATNFTIAKELERSDA